MKAEFATLPDAPDDKEKVAADKAAAKAAAKVAKAAKDK